MTKPWLLAALFVSLQPAVADAATALCAPRAEVLAQLGERYAEALVGIGIASNGGLLELLANEGGATWSLILTMPDGQSCLIAAGEDWQALQQATTAGTGI
jgi:hypothetical protein